MTAFQSNAFQNDAFQAAAAGITGTLSATLGDATLVATATATDLDVPTIGATAAAGYNSSTTATTGAVTTQSTTALLIFSQWETTSTPPTITDSKGNTFGSPIRTLSPGGGSISNYLGAWFLAGATGGASHTFTATGGASTFPSIWVVEVVDAATQANVGATALASPYNSGDIVTTSPSRLVGFAGAENTTTVTQTVNSPGFATLDELTDGSAEWTGLTAHRQASAGTYSFEIGVTSSQDGGSILVAVEKAAGGITGSLSATLGAATLSSTGALSIAGTASATLGAATLSAAATLRINGALSQSLAPATLSSTGTVRISGALAATLDAATASGAGGLTVAGTLNQTLGAATLAGTGTVGIAGTLSQTLGDATLAATGTLTALGAITGSLAATLEPATLAATATLTGGDPVDPGRQGGGGGVLLSLRPSKETRDAILAAYEAAERSDEPEAPKAEPAKVKKPAKRRDVAADASAAQAVVVRNTAMADALAKVSDGLSDLVAAREDDELAALLLILAEV